MNKFYNILEKYLLKEVEYATRHFFRPIKLILDYIIQRENNDFVCTKKP